MNITFAFFVLFKEDQKKNSKDGKKICWNFRKGRCRLTLLHFALCIQYQWIRKLLMICKHLIGYGASNRPFLNDFLNVVTHAWVLFYIIQFVFYINTGYIFTKLQFNKPSILFSSHSYLRSTSSLLAILPPFTADQVDPEGKNRGFNTPPLFLRPTSATQLFFKVRSVCRKWGTI